MSARAAYYIKLAVSAWLVVVVVRWRCASPSNPAIGPVVEAVATQLPTYARRLR